MRDQDSGDCKAIKNKLVGLCSEAGKDGVLVRVACRELESFYLGDLVAVEKGLGIKGLKTQQQGKKFRNPDALGNPAEELFRLTSNTYDKVFGFPCDRTLFEFKIQLLYKFQRARVWNQ